MIFLIFNIFKKIWKKNSKKGTIYKNTAKLKMKKIEKYKKKSQIRNDIFSDIY